MYPQSISLICVSVIFPFLASLAVVLRIWARRLTVNGFNASDYTIFLTLVPAIGQGILSIVGATIGGLGAPLPSLSSSQVAIYNKVLFASQFFVVFSIILVKISIILFYRSIFPTAAFRRTTNIAFLVLAATLIALFFVTLFQGGSSISDNWTTNTTRINGPAFYLFTAVLEVAYDLAVLFFPLPMIRGLQLSQRRKWSILGIFWLGGFCAIFSIVRVVYCVKFRQDYSGHANEFGYTVVNIIIWSSIGPSTQIIAACLPTLAPLLQRYGPSGKPLMKSSQQTLQRYSHLEDKAVRSLASQYPVSISGQEIELETQL